MGPFEFTGLILSTIIVCVYLGVSIIILFETSRVPIWTYPAFAIIGAFIISLGGLCIYSVYRFILFLMVGVPE